MYNYMRPIFTVLRKIRLTLVYLTALVYIPIFAQDSESFFDDEVKEEKKESTDLKSAPIELKGDEEEKKEKKPKKVDERGEVVRETEPVKEAPKVDGPTDQVAPLASRPKESILDNSRFSLAGNYFLNTGRGVVNLPAGWGVFLGYDADEQKGKGFDLRFEVGYMNISKNESSVTGFYGEVGISWLFRLPKFIVPMQLTTMILPGLGYYNFKDASAQGSALKLTAHAAVGVEFPLFMKRLDRTDEVIPFMQLRTGVVYDNVLPVVHYGVYVGVAYKFGAVIFKY